MFCTAATMNTQVHISVLRESDVIHYLSLHTTSCYPTWQANYHEFSGPDKATGLVHACLDITFYPNRHYCVLSNPGLSNATPTMNM